MTCEILCTYSVYLLAVPYLIVVTIEKITALESELAKLKAQIAVYALAETRHLPPVPAPPPPPPPPGIPPPQVYHFIGVSLHALTL